MPAPSGSTNGAQSEPKHDGSPMTPSRRDRTTPGRRYSIPPMTIDEEATFIKTAVFWMLLLAVTPLIILLVIEFLDSDLLLVPITPR